MLAPGAFLQGRYRILRQIGGGGMGVVYLAEDTRLPGRRCAVKGISPAQLAPEDRGWATAAFRQEAQMLATLDHPGLTPVTDFFAERGHWYLVMDFVEGETLRARLKQARDGRLPLEEALDLTWQLCEVLEYLHGHRPPVVFRDLKPGNVMITPQGEVKLIDFGIARFFKAGQTQDTVKLGTPGYAAPEQYGKGQTDARSDIYSLGVLLHEMLTGYDPQAAPFNLPKARSLVPAIPPGVENAILRATQTDPKARYRSIARFRRALSRPGSPDGSRRRLLWLVPTVAALVIGLCLGGICVSGAVSFPSAATSVPPSPTAVPATSTPLPTATPLPTPTDQWGWEVVQAGDTLYEVCRRHCPGRWPSVGGDVEDELKTYAGEVARLNDISLEIPVVHVGQRLKMPPCP